MGSRVAALSATHIIPKTMPGLLNQAIYSNKSQLLLFWKLCQVCKISQYIPISLNLAHYCAIFLWYLGWKYRWPRLNPSAMSVSMVALSGLSAIGVSAFVTQVRNTWQGKSYDGQINSNTLRPPHLPCQFPSFSQDWLSDGEAALPTRLKTIFNVLLSIWENYFWIPLDHVAISKPHKLRSRLNRAQVEGKELLATR